MSGTAVSIQLPLRGLLFSFSVCEGPPHRRGVYIQTTEEGSVARVAGIKSGDRILHCNGMDMTSVDFDEVFNDLSLNWRCLPYRSSRGPPWIFFPCHALIFPVSIRIM